MSRSDAIDPPDPVCNCDGAVEVNWETKECKECGCRVNLTPNDNPEPDPDKPERGLKELKQTEET